MISATLTFEDNVDTASLVKGLQGLPESIKPVYFSEDEGRIVKANVLSNERRFEKFRVRNPRGFFMYAENETLFDISSRQAGYAEVTLYLAEGLADELADVFLRALVSFKPVFGFACDEGEYDHRNRYCVTIGENHIESWVGRRLEKYIPGVYWRVLLSDSLLAQHGVELSDLSREALATEALGDGSLRLLKFFEQPENWKECADCLDGLCEQVDGIFSRRAVEAALTGITSFMEFDEAIALWR